MAKVRKHVGSANDAEAAFYDAIAHADLEALMVLWADDDEIVCIHPGAPRLVGHAAIRASWESIFEHGGVHIHPVQLHVAQNLMVSIHNVVEQVSSGESEPQDVHILATNIFMKTPQGWRIVVHHASIAPGKVAADPGVGAMLH